MSDWMPIEILPPDDSAIIFWSRNGKGPKIGLFLNGKIISSVDPIRYPTEIGDAHEVATHWIPLPPPPIAAISGRGKENEIGQI